jgi:transcriptional regulator
MTITAIDGSWKMNQNKPDTVRHAAANMVDGYGIGSETRILAALMHSVPDTDPGA